jgi:hypothetical protein
VVVIITLDRVSCKRRRFGKRGSTNYAKGARLSINHIAIIWNAFSFVLHLASSPGLALLLAIHAGSKPTVNPCIRCISENRRCSLVCQKCVLCSSISENARAGATLIDVANKIAMLGTNSSFISSAINRDNIIILSKIRHIYYEIRLSLHCSLKIFPFAILRKVQFFYTFQPLTNRSIYNLSIRLPSQLEYFIKSGFPEKRIMARLCYIQDIQFH